MKHQTGLHQFGRQGSCHRPITGFLCSLFLFYYQVYIFGKPKLFCNYLAFSYNLNNLCEKIIHSDNFQLYISEVYHLFMPFVYKHRWIPLSKQAHFYLLRCFLSFGGFELCNLDSTMFLVLSLQLGMTSGMW